MKRGSQMSEYPGRIILELKVVLGRRGQFVTRNIERELVLSVEIGVRKFPVHLRVGARDGEPNAGQHIICRNIVDMVLIHLCANHHSVVFLLFLSFPSRGSLLAHGLCPPSGVWILGDFVQVHVRVYGSGVAPRQVQRRAPASSARQSCCHCLFTWVGILEGEVARASRHW